MIMSVLQTCYRPHKSPAFRLLAIVVALGFLAFMVTPQTLAAKTKDQTATPMLWQITDTDSTIYLLGSIHVLRPGTSWQTPLIASAFASSQAVWFEVPDLDNQAQAQAAMIKYGLTQKPELTSGMTVAQVKRLTEALKRHGLDIGTMMRFKPWVVAFIMTQKIIADAGFEADLGVDMQLYLAAKTKGKKISGFETFDQQLSLFGRLSEASNRQFLLQTLKDDDATGRAKLAALSQAWLKGNETYLIKELIQATKKDDPALYKALIVNRNKAWAPEIETILSGSGTTLIVAGAGHFIGPDGLPALLSARGIKIMRVQ
jgi:uncharacterized protein